MDTEFKPKVNNVEVMKIKVTSDLEKANAVRKAVRENDGYCPCRLEHTPDTKCMCKEFRDQTEEGYCHCGLFYKVRE